MTTVRQMREWPVGSVVSAVPVPQNSRGRKGTTVRQRGILLERIRGNAEVIPFYVAGQGVKEFHVANAKATLISKPFFGRGPGNEVNGVAA